MPLSLCKTGMLMALGSQCQEHVPSILLKVAFACARSHRDTKMVVALGQRFSPGAAFTQRVFDTKVGEGCER